MDELEILDRLLCGEDSKNQFKEDIFNDESLAAEMVAFSNSKGGRIFVGINDKDNQIKGLTTEQIHRFNQKISNTASQKVHPAINPETEIFNLPQGIVLVITIPQGLSKPYQDNNGVIWVKSGSDKRKVTAREEMLRILQEANYLHADEMPIKDLFASDVDYNYFSFVYEMIYQEPLEKQNIPFSQLLKNMNLSTKDGFLNLTGALVFSKKISLLRPMFIIKAVHYPGIDIDDSNYIDNRDFDGTLNMIFDGALRFIINNLPYSQNGQNINTLATPLVPKIVFEELLVNALTHRNYFISSPIRIFMFSNRVEIISPGTLPNSLTIDNIKAGNSVSRNPILSTYARYVLPYRGLGNGVRRALKMYPKIEFFNEVDNNQFKVVVLF